MRVLHHPARADFSEEPTYALRRSFMSLYGFFSLQKPEGCPQKNIAGQ